MSSVKSLARFKFDEIYSICVRDDHSGNLHLGPVGPSKDSILELARSYMPFVDVQAIPVLPVLPCIIRSLIEICCRLQLHS